MSKHLLRCRLAAVLSGLGVLVLVLVYFAVDSIPAPAGDAAPTPAVLATTVPVATGSAVYPIPLTANWMDSVSGSQTRMIQAGLIVVAIGIFLLSRSIR